MISFFRATICFMRSTTILVLSRYGAVVKLWHEVFKSSTHNVKKICVKVQDQIDVTKQLVDLYPFIDKSRVSKLGHIVLLYFSFYPGWERKVIDKDI